MKRKFSNTTIRKIAQSCVLVCVAASGVIAPAGVAEEPRGKLVVKAKPGQPKPYFGELPSLAQVNIRNAVLTELYKGLKYPWAFEFISDTELLITEFDGKMKIFDLDSRRMRTVRDLPSFPKPKGQIGLLDVALHPRFASNRLLYFSHALKHDQDDLYATAVSRAVLRGDRLEQVERIFVAEPFGKSPSNFGGALAFDAQGYLYVGTGDRSRRDAAQRGMDLRGKVVRLTETGEAAPGNPFIGESTVDDRIYALGVRNPQGLHFDAASGAMIETEHGPMGGDEVNVIQAGKNYGWPVITYGANYTTQRIGVGTSAAGKEQPLFYYLPSIAVSPVTVYRGDMFPEWEGDILVGPLKGAHVNKLDWVDGTIKSEQRILGETSGRIRDIKVGPDGALYLLAQVDGRIYRLHREVDNTELEQPLERSGKVIYGIVCASCHAPVPDRLPTLSGDAWRNRLLADEELLSQRVLQGYGAMPPKGGCDSCTDDEIKAALRHLVAKQAGGK